MLQAIGVIGLRRLQSIFHQPKSFARIRSIISLKILDYKHQRSEKDSNDVLWLMERESHDAFSKSGDETGKEFNKLVNPAVERDDVVWHLSGAD